MTQLMQLIPSLNADEKIQLISALSDKISYPNLNRGLRYYALDSILTADSEYADLTSDDAKGLIRAIVNYI